MPQTLNPDLPGRDGGGRVGAADGDGNSRAARAFRHRRRLDPVAGDGDALDGGLERGGRTDAALRPAARTTTGALAQVAPGAIKIPW